MIALSAHFALIASPLAFHRDLKAACIASSVAISNHVPLARILR
jgi:hypothetical protein